MKKIITILLLLVSTSVFADYMLMPIDDIHDGDTIKTHFAEYKLPAPLNLVSIRINGIDTPEMPAKSYYETGKLGRAKCVKEAELALKARDAVIKLAEHVRVMKVENFQWGKFGGRILGDVKISGVDVATFLIQNGFGIEYHGEAKTHDWCK